MKISSCPNVRQRVGTKVLFTIVLLVLSSATKAINLAPLWDFSQPAVSERRFRMALAGANGDDALILQTQIARTYSLRKDFEGARSELRQIATEVGRAGPEAQIRYQLELGRSYVSATHRPEQITTESKAVARQCFNLALGTARVAKKDALAVDAIHMLAFLDTSPADQLMWGQSALELVEASTQADAKRWEPSIRNNIGYALHQLGQYDLALTQFQMAAKLRKRAGDASATRVADWMVAWTLRSLKRIDEALQVQLRLEKENTAAGTPDPYVFEELEALYLAKGDRVRSARYANLRKSATND